MIFKKIKYIELNAKQKEIYNYQKIAARLAEYGFNCIKLADDWQGADFLAYHKDGENTLKIQLKGRLTVNQKYIGRDLYIAFPLEKSWCIIKHDALLQIVQKTTNWLKTKSWIVEKGYSSAHPNKNTIDCLRKYII